MSGDLHRYRTHLEWSGSTAGGYRDYDRDHRWWAIDEAGDRVVPTEQLSADPAFLGDPALVNPEILLVAAASSCQLLSFLALAAKWRIDVTSYVDDAEGQMPESKGPMSVSEIGLHCTITVGPDDGKGNPVTDDRLNELIDEAHHLCFIANSLQTPITVSPTFIRV